MSRVHLTTEEKAKLTKYEDRLAAAEAQNAKRERALKAKAEREAAKERLEHKRAELRKLDESPLPDLTNMFGPEQTTLPETIRPVDIPLIPGVREIAPKDTFIEDIAAQPGFLETMGENVADVRVARFLKMIGQIDQKNSMTACAEACGLTKTDMARMWRDSKLTRAFFRIVNRMESVADKVVDDAMGARRSCPRCDGFGRVDVPPNLREWFDGHETTVCPNCEGVKTVAVVGSAPDKQLIWEKVGWSKQKGGVQVNVSMADHSVDATIDEMDGLEVIQVEKA